jgi:predicted AlkP superfamily phosphohydrolase/phosphomutase
MQNNNSNSKKVTARTPVFMVGIDGADWLLVRRLIAAGKLPALAKLMRQGSYGQLASPADEYAGGVWPDFYTGRSVAQHGIYHNKLWRQEHMRCEVPTDAWLQSRPFYEELSEQGYRVCVLDMPMVLGTPHSLNGIYLGGWGTHDLIAKGSSPADLWQRLVSEYGPPLMPAEYFGRQDAHSLLRLRDQLIKATEQITHIGVDLLGSEAWDFSCVVLGAAHRAGHYLWDDSQLGSLSESDSATISVRKDICNALEDVYLACDKALQQMLAVVPGNTLRVVFSVHGMDANHGWGDLGADLLDGILQHSQGRKPRHGLLYAVRRHMPFHLVRPLLTRLPQSVTHRLVQLWSAKMYDWHSTSYFPLPMDQAGYIRINLRGREKEGIVEPGIQYRQLCDELEHYLLSLQDVETGRAIVRKVIRAWQQAPTDAAARDVLPDLVVLWGENPATESKCIVSDRLPGFAVKVPENNMSGRSGNHVGRGWFVVHGPGLVSSAFAEHSPEDSTDCGSIRDLAPTLFKTIGAQPLPQFEGKDTLWQLERVDDR